MSHQCCFPAGAPDRCARGEGGGVREAEGTSGTGREEGAGHRKRWSSRVIDAAVSLPSGGGTVGLDYLNVQQRAAELTTSVVSDRADLPRTSAAVTGELRELLRAAESVLRAEIDGKLRLYREWADSFPRGDAGS
jgi:hypothetical protein